MATSLRCNIASRLGVRKPRSVSSEMTLLISSGSRFADVRPMTFIFVSNSEALYGQLRVARWQTVCKAEASSLLLDFPSSSLQSDARLREYSSRRNAM